MEGPKIWIGYKKVIETHLRKKVPILLWHIIVMGGGQGPLVPPALRYYTLSS